MLLCPKCNHSLTPLTVNTEGHGRINLEHCYFCGGVWLDHYDINRLSFHDSIYLSRMATKEDLAKINSSNKCPRDGNNLVQIRAESVPEAITVLSCLKCGGNFVTKDELKELKKAQKIKLDYFKTWKIPLPSINSVFIPVLLLFVATIGMYFTAKNIRQTQEARIKAKEMISTPTFMVSTVNAVAVNFTTSVPALSSVSYQTSGEKEPHTVPVSTKKQTQHTVILRNLEPNTTYSLKIYVEEIPGQILSSPNYSFITN